MKYIFIAIVLSINIFANSISKDICEKDKENFIFAGGECINYFEETGDINNVLNIIIHGAWADGTNTLARYAPFASNISMATDITTVAIALPGYSKSSTNNLKSLMYKDDKPKKAGTKEYVVFLGKLIEALKEKYNAKTINVMAHSAGAMMSATLSGYKPNLIQNIALAGGIYKVKDISKTTKELISIDNYLDKISKQTKYLVIYGEKDTISKPSNSKQFYKELKLRNIDVKIVEVKDFKHIDLDMSDDSIEAFSLLVESE
jgi:alpha-beta hydrolase superfamily lysophospholipase